MNEAWNIIFSYYNIGQHNFKIFPFVITAPQIKQATKGLKITEPRILCKQDSRENRPDCFVAHNLFILPVKNGIYNLIQGEGYVDIPAK